MHRFSQIINFFKNSIIVIYLEVGVVFHRITPILRFFSLFARKYVDFHQAGRTVDKIRDISNCSKMSNFF